MGLSPEDSVFETGQLVAGRYKIVRLLGRGGMGVVYEAEHVALGKRIALKVLTPERTTNEAAVSRFLQEARSAASIGHMGIVEIFDLSTEEDVTFIAMELLDGVELSKRIKEEAPLPGDFVAALGMEIADAVSAAHEHGITHRDLKPDNIFLAKKGRRGEIVKILDFGLAKLAKNEAVDAPETKSGDILGTPLYMSIEQLLNSKDVDGRTDIYAIGVILYQALAGVPPFQPTSFASLVLMVSHERPKPLAEHRPDISPELAAIVEKAMARDRDDRFATAKELMDALEALDEAPKQTSTTSLSSSQGLVSGSTGSGSRSPSSTTSSQSSASGTIDPYMKTSAPGELSADDTESGALPTSLDPSVTNARKRGSGRMLGIIAAVVLGLVVISAGTLYTFRTPGDDDSSAQFDAARTVAPETPDAVTKIPAKQPDSPSDPTPGAEASAVTPALDAGPSKAAATKLVTVRFVSSPPGAEIRVAGGDEPLCVAPCEASLGNDVQALVARLTGHEDSELPLATPRPEVLEFTLTPRPTSNRTKRPPRPQKQRNNLPPLLPR